MIFTLWYVFWLISATTLLAFIIPLSALFVRSTYVYRTVKLLRLTHLVVVALMFLWLCVIPGNTLQYSARLSIQVLGFMALTLHYSLALKEVRWNNAPAFVASVWFLGTRYIRLLKEKRADFEYAVHFRMNKVRAIGFRLLLRRLHVTVKTIISALIDIVVLRGQLITIINARGGFPHPKHWQVVDLKPSSLIPIAVADVIMLVIIIVAISYHSQEVVPDSIIDLVSDIATLFG